MKKFTLTINKDTFIWVKNKKGLIYNSINFNTFSFKVNEKIGDICIQLDKLESLYTILLNETDIEDLYVKKWISDLVSIESATFEPYSENAIVSLKPELKIQYDVKKITSNNNYIEMVNSLREITFHLTGANLGLEEQYFYKQFLYPTNMKELLSCENIKSFLCSTPQRENLVINFIMGDGHYPYLKRLCDLLSDRENSVTFYFRLEDICHTWNNIRSMIDKYNICLLCKINENTKEYLSFAKKNIPHAKFSFLLSSSDEYDILDNIETTNLEFKVTPVFTGKNQNFFSEYIYLDKDDLAKIKIEKRKIFMNQALNGNFFGKLEILPDGTVWDNLNYPKLGLICDDFTKLISSVFDPQKAWFYNRQQEPCNQCLYQWLCPPPSNYELVLGRANLCFISLENQEK